MNYLSRNFIPVLTLILFCFVSSCSDQMQDIQDQSSAPASQVIQTEIYYAAMPDNANEVYSIRLTTHADGSMIADREIVPYTPDHTYIQGMIVGASNVQDAESGIRAEFSEDYWVVPFDPEAPESLESSLAGVTVKCTCDGSGKCHVEGSAGPSGVSFHCTSKGCDDDCSGTITIGGRTVEVGGLGGPVLIVNSKNITIN